MAAGDIQARAFSRSGAASSSSAQIRVPDGAVWKILSVFGTASNWQVRVSQIRTGASTGGSTPFRQTTGFLLPHGEFPDVIHGPCEITLEPRTRPVTNYGYITYMELI